MLKQNKGITLVALVITIIVLLILAGVSISLVVGDNGVLTQAKNASSDTEVAKAKEAVEQAISSIQADFVSVRAADTTKVFMGYLGTTESENGTTKSARIEDNISGDYKTVVHYTKPSGTISAGSIGNGYITVANQQYHFRVTGTSNKLGATVEWAKNNPTTSGAATY